jgi:hypothetical protein
LLSEIVVWWPPKASTIFLFFCHLIQQPKQRDGVLPHRHRLRAISPYPIALARFQLVVVFPHPLEAIETQGPVAISILIRHYI